MKKVYLLLELVLYLIFMSMDLSRFGSISIISGLKFSGILICFFYVWIYVKDLHLRAALSFTVVADIFLLLTGHFVYGIAVFCIVQMIYLQRIAVWKEEKGNHFFFFRILQHFLWTAIILIFAVSFLGSLSFMESLAVFYFVSIADNLYHSFLLYKNGKHLQSRRYFFFGMLLFFLCDCNVGIYNILQGAEKSSGWLQGLYNFSYIGMWLFYMPSQVLLALSGEKENKKIK